jgi:microcompartment protein CcmL/EutN
MKKAYGFVEMKGLASAVVAVDTALKAANVEMEGLEPAKGQGMHTLKFNGEVSSVHAAVSSILGNRELSGKVFSHTVIARPSDGLEMMIEEASGLESSEDQKAEMEEESKEEKSLELLSEPEEIPPLEEPQEERVTDTLIQETEKRKRKNTVTCNLCGDPKCLRVKGEPRVKCIHYKEKE